MGRTYFLGRPLGVGARVVRRDAPDRLMARTFAVSVRRVPRGLAASRLDSAALRLGFSGRPLGVGARVVRRDAPDLLDSALMARTFAVSVRRVLRGLTASRALRLGAGAWVVG